MPSADAAIILQWVVPRHDDTLAAACIVLPNRRDNEYIPKRHTELHTLVPPASQKWTLVSGGNRETLVALPTLDMYLPLSHSLNLSLYTVQLCSTVQRYQLWYVLGSDELGATSAQCSYCS